MSMFKTWSQRTSCPNSSYKCFQRTSKKCLAKFTTLGISRFTLRFKKKLPSNSSNSESNSKRTLIQSKRLRLLQVKTSLTILRSPSNLPLRKTLNQKAPWSCWRGKKTWIKTLISGTASRVSSPESLIKIHHKLLIASPSGKRLKAVLTCKLLTSTIG